MRAHPGGAVGDGGHPPRSVPGAGSGDPGRGEGALATMMLGSGGWQQGFLGVP